MYIKRYRITKREFWKVTLLFIYNDEIIENDILKEVCVKLVEFKCTYIEVFFLFSFLSIVHIGLQLKHSSGGRQPSFILPIQGLLLTQYETFSRKLSTWSFLPDNPSILMRTDRVSDVNENEGTVYSGQSGLTLLRSNWYGTNEARKGLHVP